VAVQAPRQTTKPTIGGRFMSWIGRLHQARAALAERSTDPWRKRLEDAVRGEEAVSTSALLELVRVPMTTGNARRIAKTMRSLGFIPIKSRRLMPGGFRDTVARGWARPVRQSACRTNPMLGENVQSIRLETRMHGATG
jgi:hypothetical protein